MESLQLLIDTTGGVHYDPSRPSCIDEAFRGGFSPDVLRRAQALIKTIQQTGISKSNNRPHPKVLPTQPYILVCDQVERDASLKPSQATPQRFRAMLKATRATWPDHLIVVRTHPNAKEGHYTPSDDKKIILASGDDHPTPWIQNAEEVVVMTSQMGFEALIHGKPVTCWGTPFYAGRGLTRDFGAQPGYMRAGTTLEELVACALILAPTSFDPLTGAVCRPERVATYLAAVRRAHNEAPRETRTTGFSKRKINHLKRFWPSTKITSHSNTQTNWGLSGDDAQWRVEDGFVRSRGLGAAFAPPLSWIFDHTGGIHFDPTKPSIVENSLLDNNPTPHLERYGYHIQKRLTQENVTKYNLDSAEKGPDISATKKNILVLGQVENDASLTHAPIKTNTQLLKAVRKRHPDAHILYRPHPDVAQGLRESQPVTPDLYDSIDSQSDFISLLRVVDHVEVITSQGGLEALVHGTTVTCHGTPFYAEWGLTEDLAPSTGRRKKENPHSLHSFLAIVYGVVPRYCDPQTGLFCDFDMALDALKNIKTTSSKKWHKIFAK
jgi:capsular polysaccharide export protein